MNRRLSALIALILALHSPLPPEDLLKPVPPPTTKPAEEKIPPGLTHYMGREIAQTMHYTGAPWLVRESRERRKTARRCSSIWASSRG